MSERILTVFQKGQYQQLKRERRLLSKELTPTNNIEHLLLGHPSWGCIASRHRRRWRLGS